MTKQDRIDLFFHTMDPTVPLCINCKHFHQHYLGDGHALIWGHCVTPRNKFRKGYDTCEKFEGRYGE